MCTSPACRAANVAKRLAKLVEADPLFMLGLLYAFPDSAWDSIVDESAFRDLTADLARGAAIPLRTRGLDASAYVEDVSQDILLKLASGRFLNRYDPQRTRPRPYMLSCAKNLSKVEARSIWRRCQRDGASLPENL